MYRTLIVYPHRLLRHIRCSHQVPIKQFHYYALLPSNPRHPTMNALELTFCHNNIVTQFELDVVRSDGDDVRILDRGEADEVVHGFISDYEWWIAVGIVLKMDGMVKVVAEQRSAFICNNLVVVEQSFNLLCCCIYKDE